MAEHPSEAGSHMLGSEPAVTSEHGEEQEAEKRPLPEAIQKLTMGRIFNGPWPPAAESLLGVIADALLMSHSRETDLLTRAVTSMDAFIDKIYYKDMEKINDAFVPEDGTRASAKIAFREEFYASMLESCHLPVVSDSDKSLAFELLRPEPTSRIENSLALPQSSVGHSQESKTFFRPSLYHPLNHQEIRLLRFLPEAKNQESPTIQCELIPALIDMPFEPYSAVSYCWGPPDQQQTAIVINGHSRNVNQSLFALLEVLRHSTDLYWIDALCIQQDNVKEKSSQIPLMGRIYTGAKTVKIWLGEDVDDSAYVLDCIRTHDESAIIQFRFIRGFVKLIRRPWFTRVWVAQELVLAAPGAPTLISGSGHVSWEAFDNFVNVGTRNSLRGIWLDVLRPVMNSMILSCKGDSDSEFQSMQRVTHMVDVSDTVYHVQEREAVIPILYLSHLRECYWEAEQNRGLDPATVYLSMRNLRASDSRDQVYGSLAMCSPSIAGNAYFEVDYAKSVDGVYRDATTYMIKREGPYAYACLLYTLPILGTTGTARSPSWAFDFAFQNAHHADAHPHARSLSSQREDWKFAPEIIESEGLMALNACHIDEIVSIVGSPSRAAIEVESRLPPPWTPQWNSTTVTSYLNCIDDYQQMKDSWKASFLAFLTKAREIYSGAIRHPNRTLPLSQKPLWKIFIAREILESCDLDFESNFEPACDAYCSVPPRPMSQEQRGSVQFIERWLSPYRATPLSFFATRGGLFGLCAPGAQPGDELVMLMRGEQAEVPYVTRNRGNGQHSMIAVASIEPEWEDICGPQETKLYQFV